MTRKERFFAVYRFFLKHSWRLFIAFVLIFGVIYVCLNLGSIIGSFMKKAGEIASNRSSTVVSSATSDSSVSEKKNSTSKTEIPTTVTSTVPELPIVYIIDGEILVTDCGIFRPNLTISPWRLVSYNSSTRVAVWEYKENDVSTVFHSCIVPLRLPEHKN